jgi:hypothetical protein
MDVEAEIRESIEMFKRAVIAMDQLSTSLEFVVLQTGAKAYGCHLLHSRPGNMIPPLAETLPRLAPPFDQTVFYSDQIDWVEEYSQGKKWSWIDTRPDIIIGFVPNKNFYSLGSALGVFFSLYREINGEGAECPFPGTVDSWNALCNDSSSDMIARQTLHLSLLGEDKVPKGYAYNVADEKRPSCWREKWPILCEYFGLRGVKLEKENPIEVRKYIKDHIAQWEGMEKKYGLQQGHADNPRIYPGFEYFLLTQFDTNRQYAMDRVYSTGFTEERPTRESWGVVFDRMRKAKIIPEQFQ